jgi:hypothetical protein
MLYSQKIQVALLVCLFFPFQTVNLWASEHPSRKTSNSLNRSTDSFVTPSGNIYCALVGENKDSLRCEIRSMLKPLPPQPYSGYCEFDWGAGFLLRQQGKPEILCISDTIGGSKYELSYENIWRSSGFKCISKRTGLICSNPDGHGFFLSRDKWNIF